MIRRMIVAAAVLAIVVSIPACGTDTGPSTKPAQKAPPDPGVGEPKAGGEKAG